MYREISKNRRVKEIIVVDSSDICLWNSCVCFESFERTKRKNQQQKISNETDLQPEIA